MRARHIRRRSQSMSPFPHVAHRLLQGCAAKSALEEDGGAGAWVAVFADVPGINPPTMDGFKRPT